jgi:hypothetical protein
MYAEYWLSNPYQSEVLSFENPDDIKKIQSIHWDYIFDFQFINQIDLLGFDYAQHQIYARPLLLLYFDVF